MKFKNIQWHWGTKLVIAMIAFMLMVLSFVFVMLQQDIDLVEKDYYPKGQAHQQLITRVQNTIPYASQITVENDDDRIMVSFPDFFCPNKTSGEVHLYHRVSTANDRLVALSLNENGMFTYPVSHLHGRYIMKISFRQDGVEYYTEKNITIN
jgi:hypothetical protein